MQKVILDTNVILNYPKLLGINLPDTKFVIPTTVLQELSTNKINKGDLYNQVIDLINLASRQKVVEILSSDIGKHNRLLEKINSFGLSGTDIEILALATQLKDSGEEVQIATLDRDIIKAANLSNIRILERDNLDIITSSAAEQFYKAKKTDLQKEIVSFEKKERNRFLIGLILGFVITGFSVIVFENKDIIIKTVNVWGTIFVVLFFGILLFVIREKWRLSYGVFEFLVGALTIIILFLPVKFDYKTIKFTMDFNFKLLGGLYIMVRGQDNIVKALKNYKFGIYLREKFGIGS